MTQTVVCLGVHVLDVLVRPVEAIPEGQGGQLVEQIRMTAAGSAGGSAVVLARLGARVRSAGAVGTDAVGDLLLALLAKEGVETDLLLRRDDAQTSASVLPIRPDGSRPAFHVVGANGAWTTADVPWDAIAAADHLHLGGPEFLGGDAAAEVLAFARSEDTVTSADMLAPGDPGMLEWVQACLPQLDHFLPNAEQALGLTGAADLPAACRRLVELGCASVAVTDGPDPVVLADADGVQTVAVDPVEVVDTTGCGDAFSAGFVRGLGLGLDRLAAARLGCAAASFVASGLGSDAGTYDLASARVRAGT